MAIAEMRKLRLAAMSYDRDAVLDALHRTGAAEVRCRDGEAPAEEAASAAGDRALLSSLEAALDVLSAAVEEGDRDRKIKSDVLKDGFEVTYSEFMGALGRGDAAVAAAERINSLADDRNKAAAELDKAAKTLARAEIYSGVGERLGDFSSTAHAVVRLGTVPQSALGALEEAAGAEPLAAVEALRMLGDETLVAAAAHRSRAEELDSILSSAGFSACPFDGAVTGREAYEAAAGAVSGLEDRLAADRDALYGMRDEIKPLKTYCDRIGFEIEKKDLSLGMCETVSTFLLEAYVPRGEEERVEEALKAVSDAMFIEFTDPAPEDDPPTLMRNREMISNFETVTNMYSPPSSREFDPTTIMALFYSLFMGFIMGDSGYGLLMLVGGLVLYFRSRRPGRKSGFNSLCGVFAVGGVFAVIMGVLCNSFFGVSFSFMPTVIPDPQSAMWSIAGINIPAVLIIALLLGIVQLGAGYMCKAVQCWRRGEILAGISGGVTWTVTCVGAIVAVIGLINGMSGTLAIVGGIIAGAGVVCAALTVGIGQKIGGYLSKGFGQLYGIINFASDILSYARLYGLMLSGAVIASLVSDYGIEFITSGSAGFVILGIVIMIAGHAFNLAMSMLSAYIHDARLQYVEFYGKFFEGEGELFAPVGSRTRHVFVNLRAGDTPGKAEPAPAAEAAPAADGA